MLLAAEPEEKGEEEIVDVLFVDHATPGDRVLPEGVDAPDRTPEEIDIESFFSMPISVEDGVVRVGGRDLEVAGQKVKAAKVASGKVG
jgi:methionyl-tRNA synthetase